MATTAADITTRLGYNLGQTLGAATTPTLTECYSWITEALYWIYCTCAEMESDLGRTLGSITTIKKTITGITNANPGVVTSASHGLADGDIVLIKDVVGMTEINDAWYTVANKADDTFELSGVNTTDTDSYTAYSSGGYIYKAKYTDLASSIITTAKMGWIEKTHERVPIHLTTEDKCVERDPVNVCEPDLFYLDGSSNLVFLDTPDAALTVKIPYWAVPTVVDEATDSIPFGALFDNLLVEAVTLKARNREEFDLSFDAKWFQFIKTKAERIIHMRKNTSPTLELR